MQIQQCLRITFGIAQPTSQCTVHQRVHLNKYHGFGFPRPSCWLTLQKHYRYRDNPFYSLLQEAFLSIFSHQGNLEQYKDPLWTFKSLPYLEFHNINCAVLFALLRRKVAAFFFLSFFPFSPKPIKSKERDAWLHLLSSTPNHGKKCLVLCSTPLLQQTGLCVGSLWLPRLRPWKQMSC